MLKRFRREMRLIIRNWRLRSVERALNQAWPETKGRVAREVPPTRAAYNRERRNLDYWAQFHGFQSSDDEGEGALA
ncbi:hypothetical protein EON83_00175 [bacterium]|nr:MAG: hypothetical protein EON83_00175 [bacterium]